MKNPLAALRLSVFGREDCSERCKNQADRAEIRPERIPSFRADICAGKTPNRMPLRGLFEPSGALRSSDSNALDFDLPRRVGEPTDDESASRLAIAQHLAAPLAGGCEIAMVR
jgi:hypothetical protein